MDECGNENIVEQQMWILYHLFTRKPYDGKWKGYDHHGQVTAKFNNFIQMVIKKRENIALKLFLRLAKKLLSERNSTDP